MSRRRTVIALSGAVSVMLVAAGCGGGASSAGGDSGPIRIGFFSPKTGDGAPDGQSSTAGATEAVSEVNDHGGIDGKKIELVQYDDGSDPKQGASIATKLATQDHVVATVSGSYSPQTLAAAAIFQRNKIPLMSAYAVNPGIPQTGDFIFQQDFDGIVQGRAGAQVMADTYHAKKPAIISIDNDFGNALVQGFKAQADKLHMSVVSEDKNQFGEKNFEPIIKRALDKGADSIYMVQYVGEGKQFLKAWKSAGSDLPLLSTEGIDSAGFIDSIGSLADGMLFTTNLNRQSKAEATQNFLKTFAAKNSFSPDMVAASSHDAVMLLVAAMKAKGTSPEEIQQGLADLKNFEGATGTVASFTKDGQVVKPVQIQKFEGGKIVSEGIVDDPSIITP